MNFTVGTVVGINVLQKCGKIRAFAKGGGREGIYFIIDITATGIISKRLPGELYTGPVEAKIDAIAI